MGEQQPRSLTASPATSPMPREELLRQLALLSSRFSAYHNHKENCAWAAAALYVGLALVTARYAEPSVGGAILSSVVLVAFWIGVWKFMEIQDGLRLSGYRIEAACDRLTCEIIAGTVAVTASDCEPGPRNGRDPPNDFRFPRALMRVLHDLPDPLPSARKELLYWVRSLVAVAALLSMFLIWLAALPLK